MNEAPDLSARDAVVSDCDKARPLRILVAHNVPRGRTGGMSRMMGFIHDRVAANGHSVEYLCADDVPAVARGRWARLAFPIFVRRRVSEAAGRGEPYDIINAHEPSGAAIVVGRRALGSPAVVLTSYGVEWRAWDARLDDLRAGRGGPSIRTRVIFPPTELWQTSIGFRRADHIFCQNSEDQEYLMRRFGLPAERFTKIFAPADPIYAQVCAGRDYARAQRLLFAGTWIKRKGTDDMVPAFATLARRHPELKLTVIGAGVPAEAVLASFPDDVRRRVTYLQTIGDRENADEFARSDIYILPTLFDGGPLTSVEAMMSGLPVVTTAVGLMKEAIRDGQNGLIVPVRSAEAIVEAVERLLADRILRETLGRTAQRDALARYTWDKVAQPVTRIYESLGAARQLNQLRATAR
jgi:glycosyltransferase involved in cell wall biosynthesis